MMEKKERKKPGRKPGMVKNPKDISKRFLVNKEMNDKLAFISHMEGEYEAVYIREALQEFIKKYEERNGEINLIPLPHHSN